jgi:hypothetical protein
VSKSGYILCQAEVTPSRAVMRAKEEQCILKSDFEHKRSSIGTEWRNRWSGKSVLERNNALYLRWRCKWRFTARM